MFASLSASLNAFLREEDGATAIEYTLIGSIIAIGSYLGMSNAGEGVTDRWNSDIVPKVATAVGG